MRDVPISEIKADLFRALAHPARIRVLEVLALTVLLKRPRPSTSRCSMPSVYSTGWPTRTTCSSTSTPRSRTRRHMSRVNRLGERTRANAGTATMRAELVFDPRKAVTMADPSSDPRYAPLEGAVHRNVGGVHEDVVDAGDGRIKRVVYPPGYRWSTDIAPTVGTALCMHAHVGFLVQGHMRVEYPDGCTVSFVAPQAVVVDPGHDACVVGDETAIVVQVDFERDTVARFNLPASHTH